MGIGDWGLGIGPNPQSPIPNPQNYYELNFFIIFDMGIGDWGLGIGPNPQSPIPNPQVNNIF